PSRPRSRSAATRRRTSRRSWAATSCASSRRTSRPEGLSDVSRPAVRSRLLVAPVPRAERIEEDDGDARRRVGGAEPAPVRRAEEMRAEREHVDVEQVEEERRLPRSEEHTSELQSLAYLVCRLLLEKKK